MELGDSSSGSVAIISSESRETDSSGELCGCIRYRECEVAFLPVMV
jgi:hypothetical protein